MNLQEYKQALKKHLLTFKWLDKKLIDEIVFECHYTTQAEISDLTPAAIVSSAFNWYKSELGEEYWNSVYEELRQNKSPKQVKTLTQSEVQQLLHILRGQLHTASSYKDMQKEDAAERWEYCDKKYKFTARSFAAYSEIYASYKQLKQEEKKLVNLITKLKGLK